MSNTQSKIAALSQAAITNAKIYKPLNAAINYCYIISFIDRTNIGIARASMSIDLGLSPPPMGSAQGYFFSPTQRWKSPAI
ncbi:Uncharacterised protein [Budvicia aquatica]|uniref:Uncharacterized protein n=1 Tax=Budvicia aquatica TaxID=82979 RepID=A0A484ZAV8_9GAMM|nr:Uncharacterised protein [Budvicia aquatica]